MIIGEAIEMESEFVNEFFANLTDLGDVVFVIKKVGEAMEVEMIIDDGGIGQTTINFEVF
jgi:hypothetical protein